MRVVQSVYLCPIAPWYQVPVDVHRNLDGVVPHLLLHVGEGGSLLNEQASKGMPEIMETNMS